jgi:hypothetical protein
MVLEFNLLPAVSSAHRRDSGWFVGKPEVTGVSPMDGPSVMNFEQ